MSITTADYGNAGTEGEVTIQLFGEGQKSGKYFLRNSKNHPDDKFKKNQTDDFEIGAIDVGNLKKIR